MKILRKNGLQTRVQYSGNWTMWENLEGICRHKISQIFQSTFFPTGPENRILWETGEGSLLGANEEYGHCACPSSGQADRSEHNWKCRQQTAKRAATRTTTQGLQLREELIGGLRLKVGSKANGNMTMISTSASYTRMATSSMSSPLLPTGTQCGRRRQSTRHGYVQGGGSQQEETLKKWSCSCVTWLHRG